MRAPRLVLLLSTALALPITLFSRQIAWIFGPWYAERHLYLVLLAATAQVAALGTVNSMLIMSRKRTGLFLVVIGLLNEDTRSDRVWVFFDEQDRLTHIGATLTADEVRYSLPWSSR